MTYLLSALLPLLFMFINYLYALFYLNWKLNEKKPKILKHKISNKSIKQIYYIIPFIFPLFTSFVILINNYFQPYIIWGCYLEFTEIFGLLLFVINFIITISFLAVYSIKNKNVLYKIYTIQIIYILGVPLLYHFIYKLILSSVNGIDKNCF